MVLGMVVVHYGCPDTSLRGSARDLQGRVRIQTNLGQLGKESSLFSMSMNRKRRGEMVFSEGVNFFGVRIGKPWSRLTAPLVCSQAMKVLIVSLCFLTDSSRMLHILLWKAAALRELLRSPHDCIVNGRCKGNVVILSSIWRLLISRFDFTLPPKKEVLECPSVGPLTDTEDREEEEEKEEKKEEEEGDKQIETDGNVTSDLRDWGWARVLVCGCSFSPQQEVVEDRDKTWCPGREGCISCASLYTVKLKSPTMEEELMAAQGSVPAIYCELLLILGSSALRCQGQRGLHLPQILCTCVQVQLELHCALECGEKNYLEMTFKRLLSCVKGLLESKTSLR